MPTIHQPTTIAAEMKDAKKDYLDRHTPHVLAPAKVSKGESFEVRVKMGTEYVHPDQPEHFIQQLQLYRGDKLVAQTIYAPGAATGGKDPASWFQQAAFTIALDGPATLTAMSYCTMHGLWMSESVSVEVL